MGYGQAVSLIVVREEKDYRQWLTSQRSTRLLATLIRNQWAKKPLTPAQFWPLPEDSELVKAPAKSRAEMTPEEKDKALHQLFIALGGTPS